MILNATAMGQGDSLVLLHGLFGAARNFGVVQRQLAQRQRVIALDLRNHGASPHDGDMRYATMAADVLETLDRLSALPATLLGHSMGGKVAMQAALMHQDLTARLIVADIAPVGYPPHYRAIAEAMASLPMSRGTARAGGCRIGRRGAGWRRARSGRTPTWASPAWRIGLAEIIAAPPVIEGWMRQRTRATPARYCSSPALRRPHSARASSVSGTVPSGLSPW